MLSSLAYLNLLIVNALKRIINRDRNVLCSKLLDFLCRPNSFSAFVGFLNELLFTNVCKNV